MSDNILGKDHLDYVKSQIKTRQNILGKSNRDPEDINWENARTSWVRLMSSVNISDQLVLRYNEEELEDQLVSDNGAEFRNIYLGLENYKGNRLAKESILQGGLKNNNTSRFGIYNSSDITSSPDVNFSYGYGGNELGLKPMPGITSFTSNTYNKGSLRKAQLQILAHNSSQFQYLESLYMRLGYTMLLEWGDTKYPITNSDGSVRYSTEADLATLSLKNEFLENFELGSKYFYTRIEQLRYQSQGNYDGFLGKVENFSWEFTKEGTYVITLDLISIGSIVESLKINNSLDSIQYSIQEGEQDKNSDNPDNQRPSALEIYIDVASTFKIVETTTTTSTVGSRDLGEGAIARNASTVVTTEKRLSSYKSGLSKPEAEALNLPTSFGSEDGKASAINAMFGKNSRQLKKYIRFKSLLDFINTKLLIYGRDQKPLIEIDTSIDTFCYSNGWSFSGDPSKIVNSLSQNIKGTNVDLFTNNNIAQFHNKLSSGENVGRVMNLYFEVDYLKEKIKDNTEEGDLFLYKFLKSLLDDVNVLLGGINKLNLRITEKSYDEVVFSAEGEAKFKPTIETLEDAEDDLAISVSQFQEATFTSVKAVKEVIEIYDEVPFKQVDTNPVFNIYGFDKNMSGGTFVTDFNLKTEITPKLATQIAIGAQASGRTLGEDSTFFSKLNTGLVDRVVPYKLDVDRAKQDSAKSRVNFKKLQAAYSKYLLLLQGSGRQKGEFVDGDVGNIIFGGGTNLVNYELYLIPNVYLDSVGDEKATFKKFQEIQQKYFRAVLAYDAERKNISSPLIGFIPIKLSLTLDGLSGIRIFDKLTINSRFLPSNYTDTIDFIITELDHSIENNKWITNIGTLSVPKLYKKRVENKTAEQEEEKVNLPKEEVTIIEEPVETPVEAPIEDVIEEGLGGRFDKENRKHAGSTLVPSYFVLNNKRLTTSNNTTGYWARDYKSEASTFSTYKAERVTDLESEVLAYYNPTMRPIFRGFLNDLLERYPTGYEFRINSVVRSLGDAIRLGSPVTSLHNWGLAIDFTIYEAGSIDKGKNLLYWNGTQTQQRNWKELGVEEIGDQYDLRWGSYFPVPKYDNAHFDGSDIVGWFKRVKDSNSTTPLKNACVAALIEAFPALKPYIKNNRISKSAISDVDLRIALDSFILSGNSWEIKDGKVVIYPDRINFDGSPTGSAGGLRAGWFYKNLLQEK